ncbi:unnamed protein product [Calypogeia fissa]
MGSIGQAGPPRQDGVDQGWAVGWLQAQGYWPAQNFSNAKLKQLCYSWMQISQDPIVGSRQRNVTFWDRVAQHYNGHRPTSTQERGARSLESKWGELKHDVAKFAGTYSTVEDLWISGTNAEDTLQKAQELHVTKHPKGKSFAFTDCWYLLKDCPRFSQTVEDMNSKVNGKAKAKGKSTVDRVNSPSTPQQGDQAPNQQTMSSSLDANEDISSVAQKRPIGNKAAKKLKSDECAF